MDKREFFKTAALSSTAVLLSGVLPAASSITNSKKAFPSDLIGEKGEYLLPELPYAYNALEPFFDEQTMRLHHDIHHAAYVKGLNVATEKIKLAIENKDFSLIKHWERELAFHGAGHFLHTLFWQNLSPVLTAKSKTLENLITASFGSFENFQEYFSAAALAVEGSGWAILAYEPIAKKLVVLQIEKHQNLSQFTSFPLLVLDVWEHAYYLKYQNNRKNYITAFFNIINWQNVSINLEKYI